MESYTAKHAVRAIQGRDTKATESKNWFLIGAILFLFVVIVKLIWPSSIPFETFQFWKNNRIIEGVSASWPIFLWGIIVTAAHAFSTRNSEETNRNAEDILFGGFFISVFAGIFEEMIFRWILFLSAIVGSKISNFCFFGLTEWLHMNVFGPFVNFVTFGKMSWLIFGMGWSVGAAALISNAKFRKEHSYLGWKGVINSWIIGFFLFWIMFEYGLIAAIIVHFLYDMFIFIIRYIDAAIERARS